MNRIARIGCALGLLALAGCGELERSRQEMAEIERQHWSPRKIVVGQKIEEGLFGSLEYGGMPSTNSFMILRFSNPNSVPHYFPVANRKNLDFQEDTRYNVLNVTPEYIELERVKP